MCLGLGAGVRRLNRSWHGAEYDPPIARMRELIAATTELISAMAEGRDARVSRRALRHLGRRLSPEDTDYPRTAIPIWLAAVLPGMARLAGRRADGFLDHPVTTPEWLNEQLLPAIDEGAPAGGTGPPADGVRSVDLCRRRRRSRACPPGGRLHRRLLCDRADLCGPFRPSRFRGPSRSDSAGVSRRGRCGPGGRGRARHDRSLRGGRERREVRDGRPRIRGRLRPLRSGVGDPSAPPPVRSRTPPAGRRASAPPSAPGALTCLISASTGAGVTSG